MKVFHISRNGEASQFKFFELKSSRTQIYSLDIHSFCPFSSFRNLIDKIFGPLVDVLMERYARTSHTPINQNAICWIWLLSCVEKKFSRAHNLHLQYETLVQMVFMRVRKRARTARTHTAAFGFRSWQNWCRATINISLSRLHIALIFHFFLFVIFRSTNEIQFCLRSWWVYVMCCALLANSLICLEFQKLQQFVLPRFRLIAMKTLSFIFFVIINFYGDASACQRRSHNMKSVDGWDKIHKLYIHSRGEFTNAIICLPKWMYKSSSPVSTTHFTSYDSLTSRGEAALGNWKDWRRCTRNDD